MADLTEKAWKQDLTSILEELDATQFKKMLEYLPKIPMSQRKSLRVKMPQIIIEHYGFMESIRVIDEAMKQIPRMDSSVQEPLRRFVDLLNKKHQDGTKEKKRGVEEEEEEEEEKRATRKKKRHDTGEEKEVQKEEEEENKDPPAADQQPSCRDDKEITTPSWRKSIRDVKSGAELCNTDAFIGKVVQKSGLHTDQTTDQEENSFFYLGVADDTASIKVMVYGKKRDKEIEEGKTYMFRRLIRDNDRDLLKVTSESIVSSTKPVDVSDELMTEARKLIYEESPVFLISEINSFPDTKEVSVEGTVTEVDPVEQVEVKSHQKKRKRQRFHLRDQTGSIWINMWDEETKKIKGLSVGDIIKVTNLRTHCENSQLSLDSAEFSKIHKIESVGQHKVEMKIMGIIKATKKETQLEVEFNQQIHTLVVTSSLLATAFDLQLDDGFKDKLLDTISLLAEAEIEGNRIKKIKASS